MHKIHVQVSDPYTVTVGFQLLENLEFPRNTALIYDSNIPQETLDRLKDRVSLLIPLPAGEACKNFTVLAEVLSRLAAANFTRDSLVVALGGGATSDLAGYVAASYLRGVRFINLPTTLLGMVDASVGGKTGINLPEGKNLVGAFWQPQSVYADLSTLQSLPPQVFKEGMAELFKHHLLDRDAPVSKFYELEDLHSEVFAAELARSIQVKAHIVSIDPHEKHERAFLNFGHTLAHALEAVSKHQISHGEAVAYGMHYAAHLSRNLGGADLTPRTLDFLKWMNPAPLPNRDFAVLHSFMSRDKKADSEGIRFTLLKDHGEPYLARVPLQVQQDSFQEFLQDL
ncbi:3-dehydroquinate synthase [Deinococcus roseus]|uniref:3-dehydroquinate synthase n=1 Tax=Deinococcus roseus TaxID=392414 RepID=A0ABQ2D1L9_9DEIO|nr:3-dehydroquinate synthase [Deinococcus roseus]GGJ30845.1 3-dehydroquinate synthase [Deinococcus roseus]